MLLAPLQGASDGGLCRQMVLRFCVISLEIQTHKDPLTPCVCTTLTVFVDLDALELNRKLVIIQQAVKPSLLDQPSDIPLTRCQQRDDVPSRLAPSSSNHLDPTTTAWLH